MRRLAGIVIFLASFALAAYVVANKTGVDHLLAAVGPFRIPLAIVIFAIVASAPFSVTDALAVSNGVLFGPWLGSAVNAVGLVLAAIIGYFIALRTSKLFDIERQIERLPNWVRRFKVGSSLFLIVVRAIPGMGGTIATQTAATLHVGLVRQIVTMLVVTVPLTTLLAFGGNALSSYIEMKLVRPAERYVQKHRVHIRSVTNPSVRIGPAAYWAAEALPARLITVDCVPQASSERKGERVQSSEAWSSDTMHRDGIKRCDGACKRGCRACHGCGTEWQWRQRRRIISDDPAAVAGAIRLSCNTPQTIEQNVFLGFRL